jgi:hypothetical protein
MQILKKRIWHSQFLEGRKLGTLPIDKAENGIVPEKF